MNGQFDASSAKKRRVLNDYRFYKRFTILMGGYLNILGLFLVTTMLVMKDRHLSAMVILYTTWVFALLYSGYFHWSVSFLRSDNTRQAKAYGASQFSDDGILLYVNPFVIILASILILFPASHNSYYLREIYVVLVIPCVGVPLWKLFLLVSDPRRNVN
jgi:hypothetical protein